MRLEKVLGKGKPDLHHNGNGHNRVNFHLKKTINILGGLMKCAQYGVKIS